MFYRCNFLLYDSRIQGRVKLFGVECELPEIKYVVRVELCAKTEI